MNSETHANEVIGGAEGSWEWANEIGEEWAIEVYRAAELSTDIEGDVLAAMFANDKY